MPTLVNGADLAFRLRYGPRNERYRHRHSRLLRHNFRDCGKHTKRAEAAVHHGFSDANAACSLEGEKRGATKRKKRLCSEEATPDLVRRYLDDHSSCHVIFVNTGKRTTFSYIRLTRLVSGPDLM